MADESADDPMTGRPVRGRLFGALRDRLAASDPAYSHLRFGGRAILSLLPTAALLAALSEVIPFPIAAYGLSVTICFMGSTAVRDPGAREQALTRLLAGVGAIAAVLLASLLAKTPVASDAAFLAVIFVAVFMRGHGGRWFAIGMITVMAYFIGDFLRPAPAQIGWIALAVVLALVMTHVVSTVLLPADPERDFRRAVVTIDRRINLILRELVHSASDGDSFQADGKALGRQVFQLRNAVLTAEGFLPQGADGSLAPGGPASDLALALFHLQIAVERLVRARAAGLPAASLLRAVLHRDGAVVARERARLVDPVASADMASHTLLRLYDARVRLETALAPEPLAAFAEIPGGPGVTPAATGPAGGDNGRRGLRVPPILQQPIQVTLACGLAMGVGLLVSSDRWYWAVVSAFLVFNNTKSRGDTALRAFNRSIGTFAGIVVGMGAAVLLHGEPAASLCILPVVFFLAFYFLQTSYSLMIFFITIALALVYGLTGQFAPELLFLRLFETLVGSVAGVFVAFFVFPVRAVAGVEEALAAYLSALEGLAAAARDRAAGDINIDLVSLSRRLDRCYADLAAAARPLGAPWSAVTRFGEVREKLLLLSGCAHWGRVLARSLAGDVALDSARAARIAMLAGEILSTVAILRPAASHFFERLKKPDEPGHAAPPRPFPAGDSESAVFALEIVSVLLDRAAVEAGLPRPVHASRSPAR